jgi:hypothetical protein
VTLSSNFLSGLLETDALALHRDERHQPWGWGTSFAERGVHAASPDAIQLALKSFNPLVRPRAEAI